MTGKKVRIVRCESEIHGNYPGCVCRLIGKVVAVGKKCEKQLRTGTQNYWVDGMEKLVTRREVVIL